MYKTTLDNLYFVSVDGHPALGKQKT